MDKTIKYRIGIDVGTNSLGWSVLLLDKNGAPNAIETAGARIFADGRDEKSKATLAATRRDARSARRRLDRFKQRQKFLLDELTKANLLPADIAEREALRVLNPLKLRAEALTKKLELHHVGRALFHLNQRRGFQSNRKDRSEETTSGMVSKSIRMLLQEMNLIAPPTDKAPTEGDKNPSREAKKAAREKSAQVRRQEAINRKDAFRQLGDTPDISFGAFLWQRQQQGKPTRARPGAGEDGKLYDVYPSREMLKDEFGKIWQAQAKFHPAIMTDAVKDRICTAIFTQRPLRPPTVGKCTYIQGEDRTFRAMPSFQRYRIYQEVNNLDWTTSKKKNSLIDHPEARDAIIDLLEKPNTKSGEVVFGKMKNILKELGIAEGNFAFNLETPKRKGLDGNKTSLLMRSEDCVGEQWDHWPVEKQDAFVGVILEKVPDEKISGKMREQTDEEVKIRLIDKYALSEYAAENCLNANLEDGTASLSLKAAKLLLEKMDTGLMIQSNAVKSVAKENQNFANPFTRAREGKLQDCLPYYGEAFQDGRHIILGARDPEDKGDDLKYYGGVTNPTVHIALNQIRQVVNELISRFGHPTSIAIELGRDLPEGKEYRSGFDTAQAKNQERNRQWDDILREEGERVTRDNRLRIQLWKEQDECCPYTGKMICRSKLFSDDFEIDHLLPFSISLDESPTNKVICTRESNRYKGNRPPYEAFGKSRDGYDWNAIFERAKGIKYEQQWFNRKPQQRSNKKSKPKWETDKKSKLWRFQADALEIWKRDHDGFTARHLNDTRYIGRLTKEYLELICPFKRIDVLTGRLTALLRGHWGLNSVLHDDGKSQGGELPKKKNREDHRHHAVDAIVIGMTSRSMLQKVSTAANRAEELKLETIFEKHNDGKSAIDPWDGFRDDVREAIQNIVVSHKPRRKKIQYKETKDGRYIPVSTDGQLHNDTAYGIISSPDDKGLSEVVVRKPVSWFEKKNRIEAIRDPDLRNKFNQTFTAGGKENVAMLASEMCIRSLRCIEKLKVIPIKDKEGKVYKAYKGDSNWGMEIYEYPQGHKKTGQWEGVVISRFDANQHNFKPGQTHKPHPAARLVMRLQINDCVEIEDGSKRRLMRVQKMSKGSVHICEHQEANVANRLKDLVKNNTAIQASASSLKKLNVRKVHISPTGCKSYEIRRKPRRKIDSP